MGRVMGVTARMGWERLLSMRKKREGRSVVEALEDR